MLRDSHKGGQPPEFGKLRDYLPFRSHQPDKENERYSYIGDGIAVPHLRIDNLPAPELILGLSPDGLSFNDHKINVVFAGTSLLRGGARAVVFGTGMNTEIGKIANLTQDIQVEQSPLQKQLRGTVYAIAALAGSLGLSFLLLGWLVAGLSFLEAFVFGLGVGRVAPRRELLRPAGVAGRSQAR